MDMQDVSNLTIPEGQVRTVHDKNNRLLWGRVNYDTKYKGDIFQQTYSGKNLFDGSTPTTTQVASSSLSENITTISSTTTGALPYCSWEIPVVQGDVVRINAIIKNTNGRIVRQTWNGSSWTAYAAKDYIDGITASSLEVTAGSGIDKIRFNLYSNNAVTGSATYSSYENVIITKNNSNMSYEPFVGGIASPNPEFPQDIQVATGEQVVSITDGTNTQNFTVDLGATELCKIGNYQDYIYKSGNDWYVHKATAKTIFNGTESWQYVGGDHPRFTLNVNEIALGGGAGSITVIMSNYFIGTDVSTMYGGLNNSIASHDSVHQIWVRDNSITSDTDFKTWLSTHNATVYYALATPTDTKITDTTLISQLNVMHEWLTRYGYNATVSGNLPIIVSRTNL